MKSHDESLSATITEQTIADVLLDTEAELARLPELKAGYATALDQGECLADLCGLTAASLYHRYQIAQYLLFAQRARECLPIVLWLVAMQPDEASYHFAAGLCLQMMGEHELASRFHAQAIALSQDGLEAGPVFRLAECLSALGRADDARQLFDVVIQLGRDDESLLPLQQESQQRMAILH